MISIYQFLFFLYFFSASGHRQEISDNTSKIISDYPQGYFSFPISPGVTTSLSGSFGDIRINHFHAGLDIRTGGVEGKSVYSAGPGYVSRIKVSEGGYGNALYITHPNGFTTVYAHLKEYAPEIKAYLIQKQYDDEVWEIDLYLKPDEIPVNKGELVALSGNTGGSGGPHLHFEIRDEDENTLDPALFGFKEIKDNTSPAVEFITLRCMSEDARINGQFGSFDLPVTLTSKGEYTLNQVPEVWGDIGLEINTYDKAESSPFRLGIKKLEVKHNDISTFYYELDKLAFHNKIDMNLHTDYQRMVEKNIKLHKGYFETGNSMELYEYDKNFGVLNLREEGNARISAHISDTFENTRNLNINLKISSQKRIVTNSLVRTAEYKISVFDSIVKITRLKQNGNLVLMNTHEEYSVSSSYTSDREETFLIDLGNTFYTHFLHKGVKVKLPVTHEVSPHKNRVASTGYTIDFQNALYHPLFINIDNTGKQLRLDEDIKPLREAFTVTWRPAIQTINPEKDKVYNVAGKKPKFTGGHWNGNEITFKPKEFGTYQVLRDETAPLVETRKISPSELIFRISDALSGIASFECRVNGEWILMEYEYKNGLLWSEKSNSEPFSGEVVLKVTDHCNNTKTIKTTI
jgi:hypothetical protein